MRPTTKSTAVPKARAFSAFDMCRSAEFAAWNGAALPPVGGRDHMKDVPQERREELDQAWEPTHNPRFKPKTPSELNYRITTVIRSYLGEAPNATVEDVLAVLSDVRSEVAS